MVAVSAAASSERLPCPATPTGAHRLAGNLPPEATASDQHRQGAPLLRRAWRHRARPAEGAKRAPHADRQQHVVIIRAGGALLRHECGQEVAERVGPNLLRALRPAAPEGGPLRAQSPLRGFFALAQSPCRGFLALAQSPTDSIAWRIFSSARVGRVV